MSGVESLSWNCRITEEYQCLLLAVSDGVYCVGNS